MAGAVDMLVSQWMAAAASYLLAGWTNSDRPAIVLEPRDTDLQGRRLLRLDSQQRTFYKPSGHTGSKSSSSSLVLVRSHAVSRLMRPSCSGD